ncbi:Zn-dependent alcohol dehydrogenase [Streptomyces sp. DSM 3412]|uniref:Zn-dependent alcohol dehydrogenase n=1 Tax=Streptomyces gottesmaniae TaxID=3075518 RepID=A0ABU2Z4C8_9ACTN|nr:Zn-dependent alcohol dehydrogenase [Streptomyces sp. DSM 3412]MDT0570272.1 Zn-dependent alcohol dehydrogenase [Streptomyces sp. DSM 3412]
MTATTRALVYLAPDQPLADRTLTLGAPRPGEVQVRLRASGVCHSDLHSRDGDWGTPTPIVLGHEGAGVVERVGEGVRDVVPGDHVVLAWAAPCRRCRHCVAGKAWACRNNRCEDNLLPDGTARLAMDGEPVLQHIGLGTFSERAVVAESAVIPLPKEIPWDVASLLGCGVATGVGAVFNSAQVRPGDAVAVIGCGGVGLSAVMGARAAGAHPVIAIDLSPEKLALAEELGATHTVLGGDDPAAVVAAVRDIVDDGVDHAFECAGHPATMSLSTAVLGVGGTAVLVGMPPSGTKFALDPLALSMSGQRVVGCTYGASVPAVDFPRLARLYLAGLLPVGELISHRIGLGEVDQALDALRRRERARSVVMFD